MNNRKSYAATTTFLLLFLFLFSISGSAHAAALAWNSFLGGSGDDGGGFSFAVAVDAQGNSYVAGNSSATWGSTVRPFSASQDASVAKLADNGTLVWNTFLGGSGDDIATGIAVDADGNIFVAGYSTATWGSPLQSYTAGADIFVAKLDGASGALVWNTFLGGSGNDLVNRLAIDKTGNIYIIGTSDAAWGTPAIAYTASSDTFAAKLTSSGALTWNTFLGGSGDDLGFGIAVDASGNIFAAGVSNATWGSPLMAFSGSADGFVAMLDSSGDLTWNTFLGGSGIDYAQDIAADNSSSVYVTGYSTTTWGSPLQAYTAGTADGFVAKLSESGTLAWNTFFGGSGTDQGYGIAVDAGGNIFVAGISEATWGTPLQAYSTSPDAFAAQFAGNGTLVWNTFLGGSGTDWGSGITANSHGNLYTTGFSTATWGSPVRAFSAASDIFVAKIELPPPVQADNVTSDTLITGADISWTRGSGEKCVVFMKQTETGSASPDDNTPYAASTAFGSGTQIGSTGWFCVYNGTGTSVTVTGLTAETSYRVMVCEYNGSAGNEQYNRSDATGNQANITTLCQLNVIPKSLHKLLSIAEPIKVFVLIGSTDTVFDKTDTPAWDSTAIKPFLKLKIGTRVVLSVVFVNPFALTPGEVGVTISDCMGSIDVKAL